MSDNVRWFDLYEESGKVPHHVKFLRIGYLEKRHKNEKNHNNNDPELLAIKEYLCLGHANLERVQIHLAMVSEIGICAFANCRRLKSVEFVIDADQDEGENDNDNDNKHDNKPFQTSQLVKIDHGAFYDCTNLETIIGLELAAMSMTKINHQAFKNCRKLANVDFLTSLIKLEFIGEAAFQQCSQITTVDLSRADGLTSLQTRAFEGCKALQRVRLPPMLKKLLQFAFHECRSLTIISLPHTLEFMESNAFSKCSSLTTVYFQSTKYLDQLLARTTDQPRFKECWSLHTLHFPLTETPRHLWPLLLEQLLKQYGLVDASGIRDYKQRSTIVWNFLRHNITNYFLKDEKQKTPETK